VVGKRVGMENPEQEKIGSRVNWLEDVLYMTLSGIND
jgi:hypothetical protein